MKHYRVYLITSFEEFEELREEDGSIPLPGTHSLGDAISLAKACCLPEPGEEHLVEVETSGNITTVRYRHMVYAICPE